jgi:hypothetical protein
MTLLYLFLHIATTKHIPILGHLLLLSLPRDQRVLESKGEVHGKVEIQSNSELQSLISSPTQSPGLHFLQINAQDAYDLQYGRSSYAWKAKEIIFSM